MWRFLLLGRLLLLLLCSTDIDSEGHFSLWWCCCPVQWHAEAVVLLDPLLGRKSGGMVKFADVDTGRVGCRRRTWRLLRLLLLLHGCCCRCDLLQLALEQRDLLQHRRKCCELLVQLGFLGLLDV